MQRIADRFPAGRIEIGGAFFNEHRIEVLNLVRNVEATEKKERPMERIMAIADDDGRQSSKTTGIHVARRIGESLSHSYQGEFAFRYGDGRIPSASPGRVEKGGLYRFFSTSSPVSGTKRCRGTLRIAASTRRSVTSLAWICSVTMQSRSHRRALRPSEFRYAPEAGPAAIAASIF